MDPFRTKTSQLLKITSLKSVVLAFAEQGPRWWRPHTEAEVASPPEIRHRFVRMREAMRRRRRAIRR